MEKPAVVVASNNPVKLQAVRRGFERMFPDQSFAVRGLPAASNVSDQPATDAETLQGAENRARNVRRLVPDASYWVGVEGGIEPDEFGMKAFAWIVVLSEMKAGRSRTGAFYLPALIVEHIENGLELGEADDLVFGRSNSKQNEGAIGILTGKIIDRASLYEHAVILALVPFKTPKLYR